MSNMDEAVELNVPVTMVMSVVPNESEFRSEEPCVHPVGNKVEV